MSQQYVLHIPRTDVEDGSYVLVNIQPRSASALDAKLIGTEGTAAYVILIKPSQLKRFRANNYHGSDEEWEAILSKLLFQRRPHGDHAQALEGIETAATVSDDEGQMSIVIRKNISGITQRLGTISLQQDREEIELFEWTSIAALAATDAQEQARTLQLKYEDQQEIINKLNKQLENFIQEKKEHETALLENFSKILNAKKLKIRDQQRLLAGAKVDKEAAEDVTSSRSAAKSGRSTRSGTTRGRKAAPSRISKRKAAEPEPEEAESGTVQNEGDVTDDELREEEMRGAVTPEPSDLDETEDEDEDAPRTQSGIGNKGKAIEAVRGGDVHDGSEMVAEPKEAPKEPPPRRELPFMKHNLRDTTKAQTTARASSQSQALANDDDDGDDETNDEL